MNENQPCGHPLDYRINNKCLLCSGYGPSDQSETDELKSLLHRCSMEASELRYLLGKASKWIGIAPSLYEQKTEVSPLCNAIDRKLGLYKIDLKPRKKTLADDLPGSY